MSRVAGKIFDSSPSNDVNFCSELPLYPLLSAGVSDFLVLGKTADQYQCSLAELEKPHFRIKSCVHVHYLLGLTATLVPTTCDVHLFTSPNKQNFPAALCEVPPLEIKTNESHVIRI